MHYVVGDLHGCFFEFQKLVHKIQREDRNAKFILVGDLIDRGKDTAKILSWCMEHTGKGTAFEILLGNHELLFLDWCAKEWLPYVQGIKTTYEHAPYQTDLELRDAGLLQPEKINEIYDFLRQLPLVLEKEIISPKGIQKYVIAHAWAKKEEMDLIRNQGYKAKEFWKTFLLDRTGATKEASYDPLGDEILIHGHTPTTDLELQKQGVLPGRIGYKEHAINIDCGICYGNTQQDIPANLAAICLENLNEYYAYSLEEWIHLKQSKAIRQVKTVEFTEVLPLDRRNETIKKEVKKFKDLHHFNRPNLMRIKLIRQINGDRI